ncbi:ArpU family transcriptional regulator [Bacillus thuringiensis]|uniref:ArpU family phage packaging/lysis transcriptional regulator n=1 Tax=Bacillus thuringiensis TaxID=1428 RepID=UPI000BEE5C0D|nr:ArpU family phage packaging/lysis transcriptional regulator [Bacillus thuringiensis]MED3056302.1 ArpU family phage packaging/lysis transcriptional regulator [Bacillus thuringiensis]MED3686915.1 ArpU family phage packaging/lysis transcriptional regulator [Bacillus thuringiensis]PEA13168.1 ArpU family transcriptional regulator [Bacillus thuringiensis]PER53121.1 ArpU family transcriptional regulator [Bacillus thuringiensis]PES58060.1 ArpU family transcriptional regulator [Bacillus thuringiensi
MERQLTLLPAVDRETEKQVQKEVVKILKEYRVLKTRFENEVELKHEGISLFPGIRDTRHISNIKFKQIDKALQYVLDYDDAEIIKRKYLNTDKPKDSFIYSELSMKKDHFYYNKKNAIRLIATSLGMI